MVGFSVTLWRPLVTCALWLTGLCMHLRCGALTMLRRHPSLCCCLLSQCLVLRAACATFPSWQCLPRAGAFERGSYFRSTTVLCALSIPQDSCKSAALAWYGAVCLFATWVRMPWLLLCMSPLFFKQDPSPHTAGPVQTRITEKLTKTFDPVFLDVVNESYKHSVPKGSESHFKVTVRPVPFATFVPTTPRGACDSHLWSPPGVSVLCGSCGWVPCVQVVSSVFDSMKLLARHRAVNEALADELAASIHALSISAKTPAQWAKKHVVHDTPNCLGGSKNDPEFKKPN